MHTGRPAGSRDVGFLGMSKRISMRGTSAYSGFGSG